METLLQCPTCHAPLRADYYFCYNCGKSIKSAPPSTSLSKQILLYLGSVLLPPMGIFWGWKYLRHNDPKSRMIGIIAVVLTVVSLIVTTKIAVDYMNKVNEEVSRQLNGLQGF